MLYCATLPSTELGYSKESSTFLAMIRSERPHILLTIHDDFRRPFRPNSTTCYVTHGSHSPIGSMTHWKVLFCLDPICSLCPINCIHPSARASYEISNILVLSNHQTVTASKMRTYTRIAMAKRRMCQFTTLRKAWSIPVALTMRLVKTLVWMVLSYGAEAWTLKMRDERKITSTEICWVVLDRKN